MNRLDTGGEHLRPVTVVIRFGQLVNDVGRALGNSVGHAGVFPRLGVRGRERVHAEEREEERTAAVRQLLQWYLGMADAAGRLLIPARHRLPYEGRGEPPTSIFPTQQSQLLDWFEAELPNLVAATQQAAEGNFHPAAWQLPDALWSFLYLRRHFAYRRNLHAFGLAAARSAGNLQAEAWMLTSLGGVYGQFNEFAEAINYLERAIAICAEIGDPWGGARAMHFRGLADLSSCAQA